MSLRNNADFIALCVGDGDAFLLDRGDNTILVDGGAGGGFPEKVRNEGGTSRLDVVICTHNDSDHTGGIYKLLRKGHNYDVGEVWLPASWAIRLPNLLLDPALLAIELLLDMREEGLVGLEGDDIAGIKRRQPFEEIEYAVSEYKHTGDVEEIDHEANPIYSDLQRLTQDLYSLPSLVFPFNSLHPDHPLFALSCPSLESLYLEWRNAVHERLDELPEEVKTEVFQATLSSLSSMHLGGGLQHGKSVFEEATEKMRNIAEIVGEAYARSIPIRWYEYAPQSPGRESKGLRPVNSRRRRPTYNPSVSALVYLELSAENRHSLVFYALPLKGESEGGVLFTSDSLLCDFEDQIPQDPSMLVTTPHHGSESNADAHRIIKQRTGDQAHWVRSGQKRSHLPGKSYIALSNPKTCTRCRTKSCFEQTVYLERKSGRWTRRSNTESCECKKGFDWP